MTRFKLPKIKLPYFLGVKSLFILLYVTVCALILLPRLDYQQWYPQQFPKYDLKLSHEFSDHTKIELTAPVEEQPRLVSSIMARSKASEINDISITTSGDHVNIRFSGEVSPYLIQTLFSTGDILILKPKDPELFQQDFLAAQDISNYTDFGIKVERIHQAVVLKNTSGKAEPYSQIEIRSSQAEEEKWHALLDDNPNGQIGIVSNGMIMPAQAMPPIKDQSPHPVIYYPGDRQTGLLFAHMLTHAPIQDVSQDMEINNQSALFPLNALYISIGVLAGIIAIGLLFKVLVEHQSLWDISLSAIILLGIFTVLKLSVFYVSVATLIALAISSIVFSTISHKRMASVCAAFIITGGVLGMISSGMTVILGATLVTIGLTALVLYIILNLLGAYEN